MNRSTSYFAAASAILAEPSTWTSSREKFLGDQSTHVRVLHHPTSTVLSGIVSANQVVHNIRMPDALLDRVYVPQVVFLQSISVYTVIRLRQESRTMKTTRPKSPVTLR